MGVIQIGVNVAAHTRHIFLGVPPPGLECLWINFASNIGLHVFLSNIMIVGFVLYCDTKKLQVVETVKSTVCVQDGDDVVSCFVLSYFYPYAGAIYSLSDSNTILVSLAASWRGALTLESG